MNHPLDRWTARRDEAAARLEALAAHTATVLGDDDPAARRLAGLAARTRDGRFVVVMLGAFSVGKTTLLNALLGRPMLPARINPCTALPTEVVAGPEPGFALHHGDGRVEPVDAQTFGALWQLEDVDEAEAGDAREARFGAVRRAVVTAPCALLDHGVVLLDTPGLDDDPRRTARTLDALSDADAVVLVLSAARFLTEVERRVLADHVHPLGLTNLFFPITMVDLLDALTDDPVSARRDLEARAREALGPLTRAPDGTDAFAHRVAWLDARGGLAARWDTRAGAPRSPEDAEQLAATGLLGFEETLTTFLVEQRGRARLDRLVGALDALDAAVARQAALDAATAEASVGELAARAEALRPTFEALHDLAGRVDARLTALLDRETELVAGDLRDVLDDTDDGLRTALDRIDLGWVPSLAVLGPQGRARLRDALRRGLEGWLDERAERWRAAVQARLEHALEALRDELAPEAQAFDALAEEVRVTFGGPALSLPDDAEEEAPPETLERWVSVAVGALLLSPGTIAVGWQEGLEGAAKGAAGRLAARVVLGLVGAGLGPVGWAALGLYAAADTAVAVLSGDAHLRGLRGRLAADVSSTLAQARPRLLHEARTAVREALAPVQARVVARVRDEADTLEAEVARLVARRRETEDDHAARARAQAGLREALAEARRALGRPL